MLKIQMHASLLLLLLLFPLSLEAGSILSFTEAPSTRQALKVKGDGEYLPTLGLYLTSSNQKLSPEQVEFEEEDLPFQVSEIPTDPLFAGQWDLSADEDPFGIEDAWESTTGDPELVIAVLDTGVDQDHPDLVANLWTNPEEIPGNGKDDDQNGYVDDLHGYDFFNDDADPEDDAGHGTHVAGIIGAPGDNGIGIAGINWQVRILVLKIADEKGVGNTSHALKAIEYAIAQGARIINASWIVRPKEGKKFEAKALRKALDKLNELGILFVTAAGNAPEGEQGQNLTNSPVYPASLNTPNLLAIAASNSAGELATFSNYGSPAVDLVAPGVSILSTAPQGGYQRMSGTSVAAAFVTGASGLLLSLHPEWTAKELTHALLDSSRPAEGLEGISTSDGLINIAQALRWEKPPVIIEETAPLPSGSGGCSLLMIR